MTGLIKMLTVMLGAIAGDEAPSASFLGKKCQDRDLKNAVFYWTLIKEDSVNGQVYRRKWHYKSKYAGADLLIVNYGDDNGLRYEEYLGESMAYHTEYDLVKDGRRYNYLNTNAVIYEQALNPRTLPDIRYLGLATAIPSNVHAEAIQSMFHGANISKTPRNTYRVSLSSGGGGTTWEFDPSKGWGVTRCEVTTPQGMRIEVHSELKNFDGLWFPGRVTILKDGEVDSEVFVTHVEVGSPKDDAGIPFDDLELFEGVQLVTLQLADSTVPGRESWTGEKFVSFSDWLKHYPQDEWQERLDFLEQNEYGAYSNPDHVRIIDSQVKEAPKLWAEYVAFFVRKNGLTGQKAEKAWQLLKELQKPAYKYLDDKSLELARVEREEDPDKRQTLKGHLLGPITVIFERQLVPGLEQIVKHR